MYRTWGEATQATTSPARHIRAGFPKGRAGAFILVASLLAVTFPVDAGPYPSGWPTPILIVGDGQFSAENWVAGGAGTADDPFIVTGWPNHTYVEIRETSAHFVIRDVTVGASGRNDAAIYLYNVSNGHVENVQVLAGAYSVHVLNSHSITVSGISSGGVAAPPIVVENSADIVVENSDLVGRDGQSRYGGYAGKAAVDVRGGSNVTVRNNTLAGGKSAGISLASLANGLAEGNNLTVGFGRPAVEVIGGAGSVVRANSVLHEYDRYGTAIRIAYTRGTLVEDHDLEGGSEGIHLDHDRNSTVQNNALRGYGSFGVWMVESDNITLDSNVFAQNGHSASNWRGGGLTLRGSTNMTMRANSFEGDGLQFDRWGPLDAYASHNITPDNLLNGNPIIYRANCGSETVTGPVGQIVVAGCVSVRVANVSIGPSASGVFLYMVSSATVEDVRIDGARYGIEDLSGGFLQVRRTTINGSADGILAFVTGGATLDEVTVTNGRNGFVGGVAGEVSVLNSHLSGNRKAISVSGPSAVSILNSTILSNDIGVMVERPAWGLQMIGNNVSENRIGAIVSVLPGYSLTAGSNEFVGNGKALRVENSPGAVVERNEFVDNTVAGLAVANSSGAVIRANRIAGTLGPGLSVYGSSGASLEANRLVRDGIAVSGSLGQLTSLEVEDSNTVNGQPVAYITNCTDREFDRMQAGQVFLIGCQNTTVTGLSIGETDTAVLIFEGANITIARSEFWDNDGPGVGLHDVEGARVMDSTVDGSTWSGLVATGSGIRILGNRVSDAGGPGIFVIAASDVEVSGNDVFHNYDGVVCVDCHRATIAENNITESWGPTIKYNSACGGSGQSTDGGTEPPVTVCLFIVVPPSYAGNAVAIHYSTEVEILGNDLSHNNGSGVRLWDANDYGRYPLPPATDVVIADNEIGWNNGSGVFVEDFTGVRVFHNRFLNNTHQANETGMARVQWDDGYPNGGNYWSDHTAEDEFGGRAQDEETGADGILDEPYTHFLVLDRYPLARPPARGSPPLVNVTPPAVSPGPPPATDPPVGQGPAPSPGTEILPPPGYVAVRATVTDAEGLTRVSLCYRYAAVEVFECVPMIRVGVDEYEAWVRAPREGEILEYHVEAVDRLGETSRSPSDSDLELSGPDTSSTTESTQLPGFELGAALLVLGSMAVASSRLRRR